ncbi:energy transducer TonB [Tenacibaculum sp. MEBiC06402]|uniref:energy transducer TonB n=1 Tax=unclassified Tenacibaculum TaxID=2635139 RepID=UPI003B9B789F
MKIKVLVVVLLASLNLFGQETCDTPKENAVEDLNSISITKCSIKPSKKGKSKRSRQITVRVSASKRFLKKRQAVKKKQAVASSTSLNTSGVSEIETTPSISSSLSLKKKSAATDIAALTNSMSLEEVRKAERFTTVDELPLFTGCKKAKKGDMVDCFNEEMIKHIQKHFRYPAEAVANMVQGEVWVRFIIDSNGDVRNIKTLGPENAEILDEEAKRVVTQLTSFTPAKKDGKPVAVKYGFPINFSLEE